MRCAVRFCCAVLGLAITAAAFAADLPELPNPLAVVRPGQWVRYRHRTMYGTADQTQTVLAVEGEGDERVITLSSVMTIEDETVDERTDTVTYGVAMEEQRLALADAEGLTVTPVIIPFEGRDLPGVRVEFTQGGESFSLFLTDLVPLTGVVRMEIRGTEEPVLELLGFGE